MNMLSYHSYYPVIDSGRHSTSHPSNFDSYHPWVEEALSIVKDHDEYEARHLLIDSMIEYAQFHYDTKKIVLPRTAYSYFFQEKQPKVAMVHKKRGQNEKFQIAKKVSAWWKRLDRNEKKIYFLLAEVDKYRYQSECNKVQQSLDRVVKWVEDSRDLIASWSSSTISDWIDMYFKCNMMNINFN